MSVNYTHPKDGYEFAVTDKGRSDPRIAVKYTNEYYCGRYKNSAPIKWLQLGLIKEVKKNEGDETR